jgi:Domain of unknown function (DUF4123)
VTAPRVEQILRRLWPTDFPTPRTELFAILDGARDPSICRTLEASTLDYRCLYAGALPRALVAVAPYLVHLHAHAPFTRWLIEQSWGRSWGVFLHSAATLDELRRHLRRFLRVKDERGRRLLFRYYDPRVLRAYLPTCTPAELAAVFGPIDRFCVESADERVCELSFDGARLCGS